jgi:hypothetical protein
MQIFQPVARRSFVVIDEDSTIRDGACDPKRRVPRSCDALPRLVHVVKLEAGGGGVIPANCGRASLGIVVNDHQDYVALAELL